MSDLRSSRVSGTTTKEIAAAADVNEAIIFRHFATKEQLYIAILDNHGCNTEVEHRIAELRGFMDRNDDEGLLRTMGAGMIRAFRENEEFERLMLYASLEGHEIAKLYMQRMGATFISTLREYLERRQREGAMAAMDPGLVVLAVAGMFRFYGQISQLFGPHHKQCKDADVVDTFVKILMTGLCPPTTAPRTI
jgi:TetR/AcrR family transcriptional regulator